MKQKSFAPWWGRKLDEWMYATPFMWRVADFMHKWLCRLCILERWNDQ
jgi:hypothetical protein